MKAVVSPWRIAATVALGFAFANVSAQTTTTPAVHPVVLKQAADTKAKIYAAPFSTEIKTELLRDVEKGVDPKLTTESQFRILDRVESDMSNTKIVLEHLDAFLLKVSQTPQATPKLKKYFTDLANENRRFLPRGYNDTRRGTVSLSDEFLNYPDVIDRYNAFLRVVAASTKAPPMLKASTEKAVKSSLDMMGGGSGNALSWDQSLDADKNRFTNYINVIDDIVAFEAQARAEVPTPFPNFKANTIKEAEEIRVNVGNPAYSMGRSHLESLRSAYRDRLGIVRMADEIVRKTLAVGLGEVAWGQLIRNKLERVMPAIEDYRSGEIDRYLVEDLLLEVRKREEARKGGN